MRNMSFSMTESQILDRSKTVTRRLGWKFLKPGDTVRAVHKAMGFKKGEKPRELAVLRIVSVDRIPAYKCSDEDAAREGYPEMSGAEFAIMFCEKMKAAPNDWITRIQFEYVQLPHAKD